MADLWTLSLRDLLINSGVCTVRTTDVTVAVAGGTTTLTNGTITPLTRDSGNDGAIFVDTAQLAYEDTGGAALTISNWLPWGLKIAGANQSWQFAAADTVPHYVGMLIGGNAVCSFVNPPGSATVNAHIYVVTISIPNDVYNKILGATYQQIAALAVPGAGRR